MLVTFGIYGDVKEDTGFRNETLMYIYLKYCGINTPIKDPHLLYRIYTYLHLYPTYRQSFRMLDCCPSYVAENIMPGMRYLASVINEIDWNSRLSLMNHAYYFPGYVTSMFDTFPVYIDPPSTWSEAKYYYMGKYKATAVKFLVGLDFIGRIVFFSGPYLGSSYDGHLFNNFGPETLDSEIILGDQHFCTCRNFLTPYRAPNHGNLCTEYLLFNAVLSHYRARIEHINAVLECHSILKETFRGDIDTIKIAAKILAHTINVEQCRYLKYQPYGPWPHFPVN